MSINPGFLPMFSTCLAELEVNQPCDMQKLENFLKLDKERLIEAVGFPDALEADMYFCILLSARSDPR